VAGTSNVHGSHAVQEATYAYAGWIFAQHFCNRLGPSYSALRDVLDESNAVHAEVLNNIKVCSGFGSFVVGSNESGGFRFGLGRRRLPERVLGR
jgi:hypothetical protein